MKKSLIFIALFLFIVIAPSRAQEKENCLEFSVMAEKEYEATSLNIAIETEAENKDLSKALAECNNLLSQAKAEILTIASEKEIEVNLKYVNSFPETSFFSDYYKVKSRADIKIKDKKLSEQVFAILKKYEKIKLSSIFFTFKDENEIENELIIKAGELAEKRLSAYKEAFKKDFELIDISDPYQQLQTVTREGFAGVVSLNVGALENAKSYSQAPLMTDYPKRKFSCMVTLKYKLLPLGAGK